MTTKNLPLPGEIIKKSNALCRASWSPEVIWEARLVAIVASKVRQEDEDFKTYEIPISEILDGKTGGSVHKLIDKATDITMSRIIKIQEKHGGWSKYNVFGKCEYLPKEGFVKVRFDKDLKPHYLNLNKRFAEISLFEYLTLPSIYSQRIFEILKSYDDIPEIPINLNDLHEMLDVPESLRKNFKDFRRRVLEKAHKDITEHTSLKYEWQPIAKGNKPVKRGMTTVAIKFIFSKPRIEKKKSKDKQAENSKKKKQNNKIALAAVNCHKQKGGDCKEDLGKDECEFCRDALGRQVRVQ